MTLPDPVHVEDGHRGAFTIEIDGKRLAEMTYTRAGRVGEDRIIIDHTAVDDQLRGTGAGKRLLQALVDWARATRTKVIPVCPFAKATFDKTPELQDVL
jgi:predicted GNAT family acetyltransferase